jgi:hypothetical protein
MTKPLPLETILQLDEKGIEAAFPFGAVLHKGKGAKLDRFSPAGEGEADRSLAWLKREKRKRIAPIRYMGKTHGYTSNPAHALYTSPDCGEAIDAISQQDYSENGWQGFLGGLEAVDSRHPHLYVHRRIKKKAA